MEGFIAMAVIFALISIFANTAKQQKKAQKANPLPGGFPPQPAYSPQQNLHASVDDYPVTKAYETHEGVSMEHADLNPRMGPGLQYQPYEPENPKYGSVLAETQEPVIMERLKLFESKNEVLKAVIYSEIMRPKFRN